MNRHKENADKVLKQIRNGEWEYRSSGVWVREGSPMLYVSGLRCCLLHENSDEPFGPYQSEVAWAFRVFRNQVPPSSTLVMPD